MLKTFAFVCLFMVAITGIGCLVTGTSSHNFLAAIALHAKAFGTIAAVIMGIPMIAAWFEKRSWNNGICAQYSQPWVHFDNDSQGGRGYNCNNRTIWISYPVDSIRAGSR